MFSSRALEKLGCPKNVADHCFAVSKKALEIAKRVKFEVSLADIEDGAVLHDIGRCRTNGIRHAVVGAEIARELGAREEVVRVVERHIGAGITRREAAELGLPARDYIPDTPEEKIVAYADNLTLGTKYLSFEESLKKFVELLGKDHPSIKRFTALHMEIQSWTNKQ
jgi:uncharacterized protein